MTSPEAKSGAWSLPAWQVGLGVFLVVQVFAFPGLPPGVRNWDNVAKLQVAQNILKGVGPLITEKTPDDPTYIAVGADGRNYPIYPLLAYVQQFPVLAAGLFATRPPEGAGPLLILAFTAWVLVAWGRRNQVGPVAAAAGALVACFGTPLWASAAQGYDIMVEVFALAVVLWAASGEGRPRDWAWAGLAAGAAWATRLGALPLIAPAVVLVVVGARSELWKRALAYGLGYLPGAAIVLGFNWYRFGGPFKLSMGIKNEGVMVTSSADWFSVVHLEGIAGLLVSPGKGIIWYAPLLLVLLALVRPLARAYRASFLALAVYAAAAVTILGRFSFWSGEWCWGPRYVAPLNLAVAPLAWWVFERAAAWSRGAKVALAAGLLLLAAAQAVPVVGYPVENHLHSTIKRLADEGKTVTRPIFRPPLLEDNRVLYFSFANSMMVSLANSVVLKLSLDHERPKLVSMFFKALLAPAAALALVAMLRFRLGARGSAGGGEKVALAAQPASAAGKKRRGKKGR